MAKTARSGARFSSAEIRRAIGALRVLVPDPTRLDQVFRLSEILNGDAFARLLVDFESHEEGKSLLRDRPYLDEAHLDFAALRALPERTLGRCYADYLTAHALSPKALSPSHDRKEERAEYILQRIRQTHDLWHVVCGYAPDIEGEALISAFIFAQLRAPSFLMLAALGTLRSGWRHPRVWRRVQEAFRAGQRAKYLAPTYWERYWDVPIAELRERLGLPA